MSALNKARQPHRTPVEKSITAKDSLEGLGQEASFWQTAVAREVISASETSLEWSRCSSETSLFNRSKYSDVESDVTCIELIAFLSQDKADSASIGVFKTSSWVVFRTFDAALTAELGREVSKPPSHKSKVTRNFSAVLSGRETNVLAVSSDFNSKVKNFRTSEIVELEMPLSATTIDVKLRSKPRVSTSDCNSFVPASSRPFEGNLFLLREN
mmetsp:Transcript_18967/g.30590  ORF Transcript_18967/g.30590 Transcript_18967/m.30590 type:complete len:213 (+) Transcript_18967:376-1014(+)